MGCGIAQDRAPVASFPGACRGTPFKTLGAGCALDHRCRREIGPAKYRLELGHGT